MKDINSESGNFYKKRRKEISDNGKLIPVRFESLEKEAKAKLRPGPYAYTSGGAGEEQTMASNRRELDRYEIVPRVLRDVSEINMGVELFGKQLPTPLVLAPIGSQRMYHEDGELGTARAAKKQNVPMTLSTWSSTPLELVAEVMADVPKFFQLYWMNEWEVTESFASRAESAGYDAIFITLDGQRGPWQPRSMETNYSINTEWSTDKDAPKAIFLSDPIVADSLGIEIDNWDSANEETIRLIKSRYKYNSSLTWEDINRLREVVDIPIVLKGILHPEDAKMALDIGMDGIVVSSHGGRRIDGAIGAASALDKISEKVNGEIPILFDSGIRTGTDAFKALALGATAVQVGRPYAYGLTLAGEQGVYETIGNLLAELESTIGVAGYKNLKEVRESSALVHYPWVHELL
tara:strand:+ start:1039 stop:2259 length:1221 start_codon:yes stop_codon:yes gene_type:complete